jgi:hypothetical protein
MIGNSDSRRYNNPVFRRSSQVIGSLLGQLQERRQTQELSSMRKVRDERKMHHSMSLIESRRNELEERSLFNNKTKQGGFIDDKFKPVPYIFIPKHKN